MVYRVVAFDLAELRRFGLSKGVGGLLSLQLAGLLQYYLHLYPPENTILI